MLNLKNAFVRLEHAKKQEQILRNAFNKWMETKGIEFVGERDPKFARYGWFVVMHREPEEHLALVAGEIFNNLRSALDYVAFQIYLAAGGDETSKEAKAVAFPIVTEEERWDKVVKANVPGAWEDAVRKLQWCQPFVQFYPNKNALPVLQRVGSTDKHRDLVMYAIGIQSINGIAPKLEDDQGLIMYMVQPGPEVELNSPKTLGKVFLRRGGEMTNINDEDQLIPWSEGVELQQPSPPGVTFGFRSKDGAEVTIDGVPDLIGHVEQILNLFKNLRKPAAGPAT